MVAEHPLFHNTGVKKLTVFKEEVKGFLFDMTDVGYWTPQPTKFLQVLYCETKAKVRNK